MLRMCFLALHGLNTQRSEDASVPEASAGIADVVGSLCLMQTPADPMS